MKIHNKLFLALFSFSLLLVSTLVFLVQLSIDKGMVEYVNTREITLLQPLALELSSMYQFEGNWQFMENRHRKFKQLLENTLAGSEFSLPPKNNFREPKRENRPPPPRNNRPRANRFQNQLQDKNRRLGEANNDVAEHSDSIRRNTPPPKRNDAAPRRNDPPPKRREPPPNPPEHKVSYALLDVNKQLIVGDYPQNRQFSFTEIINPVKTEQIYGYLAISKRDGLTKGYEFDFIEQQKLYLWLMAIVVMLLVVVVTFPIARHLVRPIRQLTQGMHKLTQGDYQQKITSTRKDELGTLSRDYNELALTLEQNENIRKRWLANISHELRTPIAILRGELEAMLDKVRPISAKGIESANQEVIHLQRLVDDLHELTSADIGGLKYRKEKFDLTILLAEEEGKYLSYLKQTNLELKMQLSSQNAFVYADETRICQLIENLLNNAVKYAGSGCKVWLKLDIDESNRQVKLIIEDNGSGVSDEHLSHLFEHLYRVDDSRNRETGGTGLGLSICAQIVKGHQGSICAEKSKMGGLAIIITLPLMT